jgi:hypothetical protein
MFQEWALGKVKLRFFHDSVTGVPCREDTLKKKLSIMI